MSIGENIKRLRDEQGLTQRAVADRIGTTTQSVSNWEAGKSPSSAWMPLIASALGVTIEDLYVDQNPTATKP